jgi:uroporphyrinogen-III synthase
LVHAGEIMALTRPTIVLTRAHEDNQALRARLELAGVDVLELPTAQFSDVALAPAHVALLPDCAALTFASPHAVAAFARQLSAAQVQAIHGVVAAVGPGTAAALARIGLHAALVADAPSTGEALAALVIARLPPQQTVVVVQARQSQPELVEKLRAAGHTVHVAIVYENAEPAPPTADLLAQAASARAIFFAAPSAADRLLAWAPGLRDRPLVAIGTTTAAALRDKFAVEPAAVAASPDLADVAAALLPFCVQG